MPAVNRDMAHLDFGEAPRDPFQQQIMIEGHGQHNPSEQEVEDAAVYDEDEFDDYDGEEFLGDPDDEFGEYGFEANEGGSFDNAIESNQSEVSALLEEAARVHLAAI